MIATKLLPIATCATPGAPSLSPRTHARRATRAARCSSVLTTTFDFKLHLYLFLLIYLIYTPIYQLNISAHRADPINILTKHARPQSSMPPRNRPSAFEVSFGEPGPSTQASLQRTAVGSSSPFTRAEQRREPPSSSPPPYFEQGSSQRTLVGTAPGDGQNAGKRKTAQRDWGTNGERVSRPVLRRGRVLNISVTVREASEVVPPS